jgi:hypothetical protein
MISYKQFLLENGNNPIERIADKDMYIDDVNICPGDSYYLNSEGHLDRKDGPAVQGHTVKTWRYEVWMKNGVRHRLDGPAITWPTGEKWWYVDGEPIFRGHVKDRDIWEKRWQLLQTNIENNFPILNGSLTKEMQKYVIEHRPDLIGKIKQLSPEFAKKYKPELNLGEIEI